MSKLFETTIVEKRNVLNELRSNNMTLQELRFFSIYLSKINPRDISTRVVRFPIEDFQRIMGFGKMNIRQLRASTDSLLTKIVHIPTERGGYTSFQLFKECCVDQDDNGKWFMEIDAHDKALPLMFDFKSRYFKYELWNALRLKSPNQLRMYEILKQYENIGRRELKITELRELLGIDKNEYTYWQNFKVRVLDSCQQALKETTDICYTYERGRTGKGGKWLTIIFHIQKNKQYSDPLTLSQFIQMQPKQTEKFSEQPLSEEDLEDVTDYGGTLANLLAETCNYEFTVQQIKIVKEILLEIIGENYGACSAYLKRQMNIMDIYRPKKEKRFSYLLKMMQNDLNNKLEQESLKNQPTSNAAAYDLEEYDSTSVADEME